MSSEKCFCREIRESINKQKHKSLMSPLLKFESSKAVRQAKLGLYGVSTGFLYCLWWSDGWFKIGCSVSPAQRVCEQLNRKRVLRSSEPIWVVDAGESFRGVESLVHSILKPLLPGAKYEGFSNETYPPISSVSSAVGNCFNSGFSDASIYSLRLSVKRAVITQ